MKITNIYFCDSLPNHNLITLPNGRVYVFYNAPYRVLTEKDLIEVKLTMPIEMYLKAVGAYAFPEYCCGNIAAYGLERA